MTKNIIQIENIEADELINRLDRMESAISALTNQPQPTETETQSGFLSRREVAKFFGVSLVTVNDWTRKGILVAYKIGNRVYFKRSEVEASLVKKGGHYVHRPQKIWRQFQQRLRILHRFRHLG